MHAIAILVVAVVVVANTDVLNQKIKIDDEGLTEHAKF